MSIKNNFIAEFKRESGSTRKMLDRVPVEHFTWKPHAKSNSLEQLAKHIANLPNTIVAVIKLDERDILNTGVPPLPTFESKEQLMIFFENNYEKALNALENADDSKMQDMWTLRAGPRVIVSVTREEAIRIIYFGHSIHHRGQLSVYLRLLDVPVPGMYGPTADEGL
jgi:uncharacterized damage-inducible protein DinB